MKKMYTPAYRVEITMRHCPQTEWEVQSHMLRRSVADKLRTELMWECRVLVEEDQGSGK